jgi:hypothetical protein
MFLVMLVFPNSFHFPFIYNAIIVPNNYFFAQKKLLQEVGSIVIC